MNLLDRIKLALTGYLTGAGQFWHTTLEPWFENFLATTVHEEVDLAAKAATDYITEALPALTSAVATGNWATFADTQATIIKNTAADLEASAAKVAVTSVSTAVTALIAGHPDVVAATQATTSQSPAIAGTDSTPQTAQADVDKVLGFTDEESKPDLTMAG